MGLFDNFKPNAANATPGNPNIDPALINPALQSSNQSQSAAANNLVPNANTTMTNTVPAAGTVAANGGDKTPLDQFAKLWENDPSKSSADMPFAFNTDPTKLLASAREVDFTKIISPELNKRITAGGADAQQAMLEAMNQVSQLTYAQSSQAASKIAEQAVAATEARFMEKLPGLLKQYQVRDSFDNPLLTNPASAPMVEALQIQMTKKFPTASSEQIRSHVNDYLNTVADMITAQRPQPKAAQTKPAEDWSKFFV